VSDNGLESKSTWTKEDWEEYRSLSWTSRRLTDLVMLVPPLGRWVGPLMLRNDERRQRKRYERTQHERTRQEQVARSHRIPGPRARGRKK
jgi:hypothetical protein